MRGVKDAITPPCRMKVPSCTVRTRSTAGLYVIVNVTTETRAALLIETGIVYGPPATWKVVPGGDTMIWAGVVGDATAGWPAGVVGTAVGALGNGAVGACPGAGGTVVGFAVVAGGAAGGVPSTVVGGVAGNPGAGSVATGLTIPGTGDVPGGAGRLVGGTPPGVGTPPDGKFGG